MGQKGHFSSFLAMFGFLCDICVTNLYAAAIIEIDKCLNDGKKKNKKKQAGDDFVEYFQINDEKKYVRLKLVLKFF